MFLDYKCTNSILLILYYSPYDVQIALSGQNTIIMNAKQRKDMAKMVKSANFANKAERKAAKKAFKDCVKQSDRHISIGLEYKPDEFRERYDNTRGNRTRFGANYVSFEMEFGVSKQHYKGERCTRSKQYKSEGIIAVM